MMEEIVLDRPDSDSPEIIEVKTRKGPETEPLLYEVDPDIMQIDRDLQENETMQEVCHNRLTSEDCMLVTIEDESDVSNSGFDRVKTERFSKMNKDPEPVILLDNASVDSKDFDECPVKKEENGCNCLPKDEPLTPKDEPEPIASGSQSLKHPRIMVNFGGNFRKNEEIGKSSNKNIPSSEKKSSDPSTPKSVKKKIQPNIGKFDKIRETFCSLCSVKMDTNIEFITHMAGKKHSKNVKGRQKDKDYYERTLSILGFNRGNPQAALRLFVNEGVKNVEVFERVMYLEFYTKELANKCLEKRFNKLKISPTFPSNNSSNPNHPKAARGKNNNFRNPPKEKEVEDVPPISNYLFSQMTSILSESETDQSVMGLMNEIALKGNDLQMRERIRFTLNQFLNTLFPGVRLHIFGSSSNNLGFVGCDLDLYADLGFDIWATGQFHEKVTRAADLTKFLTSEIRKSRIGYNVIPIPKARVPIVKFTDKYSGIQVDLSFKHMMPVHNTRLINIFSNTHPIVRPYMFMLRYWAKVHNIAKGGQPSSHFTNYCFTLLMSFWLMIRKKGPILPHLMELRLNYVHVLVDGWDCGFNSNVNKWSSKYHDISLVELAYEFFDFYGNFNFDDAVVCPLLGQILSRKEMQSQDRNILPPIFSKYCSGSKTLELKTACCLQDPFEHSHNVARGLSDYYFAVFQYKCRKSCSALESVMKRKMPIGSLFEPIPVVANQLVLRNPPEPKTREEDTGNSVAGVKDLFTEADDDVVEVEIEETKKDGQPDNDVEVEKEKDDNPDIIIEEDESKAKSVLETIEKLSVQEIELEPDGKDVVVENGIKAECDGTIKEEDDIVITGESSIKICGLTYNPEKELYNFMLDFALIQKLTIENEGNLSFAENFSGDESKFKSDQAISLIKFIFKRILFIEIESVNKESSTHIKAFLSEECKKRKNSCGSCSTSKKFKNYDGEAVNVIVNNFDLLTELCCETSISMWVGRRKTSRSVKVTKKTNPLEWEIIVSETHANSGLKSLLKLKDPIKFATAIWQDKSNPNSILVTFKSRNEPTDDPKFFAPMTSYITYLTKNILSRLANYVLSSKGKS